MGPGGTLSRLRPMSDPSAPPGATSADASSVTLYTTAFCGYCVAAKRLLQRERIPYEEIDLRRDANLRHELVERTGWRTVPMIFIGDRFVGGYQELAVLHQEGGLEGMGEP